MSGQDNQREGPGERSQPGPPFEGAQGGTVGPEHDMGTEAAFGPVRQDDEALLSQDRSALIQELERERDEYKDQLLRLQAEFDNYRKRVDRQQRDMVDNAATGLVRQLLPVLDAADLALAHGGGEEVKQVAGALFDVLAKEGLKRIVPEGQSFDPEQHDAVAHEPAQGEGAPEVPEVSEVLRAGYEWRGRVMRPAMVKVRG